METRDRTETRCQNFTFEGGFTRQCMRRATRTFTFRRAMTDGTDRFRFEPEEETGMCGTCANTNRRQGFGS